MLVADQLRSVACCLLWDVNCHTIDHSPATCDTASPGSRPCADAAALAYLPLCSQCDNPRRRRHEVQYVQAVWESVTVQRRAQSNRHGGIGDHVTALMNKAMRNEKLLGVAKMRGLYQGTAAWDVPYTVVYIDFDVQYHVRLTRVLDYTMVHTLTRVNLRNTLAIVCCSNRLHSHIPSNPHDALGDPMPPLFRVVETMRVRHTFGTSPLCSYLYLSGCYITLSS